MCIKKCISLTGDKVVLCVNNLGALSCLEIAVVSKAALHCLGETQVAQQLDLKHLILDKMYRTE